MKRQWKAGPLATNGGTRIEARVAARLGVKPQCGGRMLGQGAWCLSTDLLPNGRCKLHGGLSTGPNTPEGKARALEALQAINARRKREKP